MFYTHRPYLIDHKKTLRISVYILLISLTTNKPEVAKTKNRQCHRFESQRIQKFLAKQRTDATTKRGGGVCGGGGRGHETMT